MNVGERGCNFPHCCGLFAAGPHLCRYRRTNGGDTLVSCDGTGKPQQHGENRRGCGDAETSMILEWRRRRKRSAPARRRPKRWPMRCWRARRRTQSLNAFIALEPDKVRAAAREADRKRASGASVGPLHGVPLALKDNLDTADYADHRRHARAGRQPPQAQRRHRAGVCSTPAPSCSANAICMNSPTASPTTTPRSARRAILTHRTAFRGLRAAAPALRSRHGLRPGGIGSDTGGSVRIPAALCGIVGLRPTTGRWSQAGIVPISHTRDTAGPMTRSVADCVLIDGVVTGGPLEVAPASLKGLRIGVPRRHFWDNLDPELGEICESALQRLSQCGRHTGRRRHERGSGARRRGRLPDRALRDGHRPQPISERSWCGL